MHDSGTINLYFYMPITNVALPYCIHSILNEFCINIPIIIITIVYSFYAMTNLIDMWCKVIVDNLFDIALL